tara:strand:+ start:6542 stop:7168 length:627 start_codon:yes stop_codon:yes gene_type:complete
MAKKALAVLLFVMATSSAMADAIVTESTSNSTTDSTSNSTTTVKSPPPTAVAPAITVINNDVCATAASGAVQTQILGISMGGTVRDMNCERIKLSKNLYDMGMKVAAVATLCQDERVFQSMIDAGTPCPVMGKIGQQAKDIWIKRGRVKEEDYIIEPSISLAEPKPTSTPVDKEGQSDLKPAANTFRQGCSEYSGSDPIVIARVCDNK